MNKLRRKRVILPVLIFILVLAAYAQKKAEEKCLISGYLQAAQLNETSGIAASGTFSDTYYIHNDSGDTSRFFAINSSGQLKCTYYFKGEISGRDASKNLTYNVWDCEDIAVGPGPDAKKSYVYLADIGDNGANRPHVTVYRIPEAASGDSTQRHVNAAQLFLKYPDAPKDAETLMVDPIEKLLYIVSKRRGSVTVYTAPLKYNDKDTVTLTSRCQLHFKGLQPLKWIVGGDISKDGSQILLKSYARVYYWKRNGNEPVWQTMQGPPQELPYEQEPQGEAIGFAPDGKSYYTISERDKSPIYHYKTP